MMLAVDSELIVLKLVVASKAVDSRLCKVPAAEPSPWAMRRRATFLRMVMMLMMIVMKTRATVIRIWRIS